MQTQTCPECGRPLPSGSAGSLCPNCLLKLGLVPVKNTSDLPAASDVITLLSEGAPPDSAAQGNSAVTAAERSGDRVGRYKLLEPIGEGGFGVVWAAQQEEPVRRRVALKIIKLGMDTKHRIEKFARRNKVMATATSAVALALALGVAVSTWQAVRAKRSAREALSAKGTALNAQRLAEANSLQLGIRCLCQLVGCENR